MTTTLTRPWHAFQTTGLLYGADYNPEQWTSAMGYDGESVWLDDMRLMQQAGVNIVSVGIFGWALLQPDEHTFSFDWLDRLLDLLAEHGISACLATATAAQPAWLSAAYPEILPVNADLQRAHHGGRMNFCPTSPVFRHFVVRLVRRLAERYGNHRAVQLWHISNEYGPYCYCDGCAARFRTWLAARYGSLAALNQHWVTPFWGHVFTSWDQVEPPSRLGDQSMQGLTLDYQRFMSDMNLECYRAEADILRELTPQIPVMTNFHGLVKHLDYFSWAPYLDLITWDSYPPAGEHPGRTAFRLALMRGLKGGQPWLLLEQTPSQTQWRPINPLKRPGEMRLQSYQAIAHGSNGAMFFQWRQSRGAAEMYHGAIVSHAGHDQTRVFREVAQFGAELPSFGPALLESRVPARVALMFSWPIWWAVEFQPGLNGSISYLEEATRYFAALWGHQVAVDLITPDTPLGAYDLVVAPLLHMVTASQATAIEQYVAQGGAFLTTYFSGVIDTDARALLGGYPGPLRRTLGIWVEEFDPLLAGATNRVVVAAGGDLPVGSHTCDLWCEVVHCEGAQALATFGEDFYTGMPAVTRHAFGQGHSYYVATRPDAQLLHDLFGQILQVRGIQAPLPVPDLVEVVQRVAGEQVFTFLLNHQPDPQSVALPKPMRDILTGQIHTAAISLAGRGVAVLVEHAG